MAEVAGSNPAGPTSFSYFFHQAVIADVVRFGSVVFMNRVCIPDDVSSKPDYCSMNRDSAVAFVWPGTEALTEAEI